MVIKRKTKKDLEKEIFELNSKINDLRSRYYELDKKYTEAQQKVSNLESNVSWLTDERSGQDRLIRGICQILKGKASLTSKAEVLMDILNVHEDDDGVGTRINR